MLLTFVCSPQGWPAAAVNAARVAANETFVMGGPAESYAMGPYQGSGVSGMGGDVEGRCA